MPRVKTLQIVWHGKEPVYSVDFDSNGILATAGADKEVKLWEVSESEDGNPTVNHLQNLSGHSKTVNCIRFSPTGRNLVVAGDGGELALWQNADQKAGVEGWKRSPPLRGHHDDVMDISWSTDGTALISGSIDNSSILWEVTEKRKGAMLTQFKNHKHFIQGVSWDPAQQLIATQSADRTCKVYALRPPAAGSKKAKTPQHHLNACETAKEFYCSQTLSKQTVTTVKDGETKIERQPLFHDESIPSFFRRLAWSPDGSFLLCPAGVQASEDSNKDANTVYIYARGQWAAPVAHLPGHTKPVVAVRFCPTVFKRNNDAQPNPPYNLPYKIIFAVATLDSVIVYDTDHTEPLAVFGHLHYDSITDLAWSKDGRYLAIASRDCYCSIAVFEPEELGIPTAVEGVVAARAPLIAAAAAQASAQLQVGGGGGSKATASKKKPAAQNTGNGAAAMEIDLTGDSPVAAAAVGGVTPAAANAPTADNNNTNKAAVGGGGGSTINNVSASNAGEVVITSGGKKRIKPTPLSNTEVLDKFGNAKEAHQQQQQQQQADPTQETANKTQRKRIKPIPINPTPTAPAPASISGAAATVDSLGNASTAPVAEKEGKVESSGKEGEAAAAAAPPPPVQNIALMALAAVQQQAQGK